MVPAATAEFDYRYVTTAVPFGCLALALAFGTLRRSGPNLAVPATAQRPRQTTRIPIAPTYSGAGLPRDTSVIAAPTTN